MWIIVKEIYQQQLTRALQLQPVLVLQSSHSLPTRGNRLTTRTPECAVDVVYTVTMVQIIHFSLTVYTRI